MRVYGMEVVLRGRKRGGFKKYWSFMGPYRLGRTQTPIRYTDWLDLPHKLTDPDLW